MKISIVLCGVFSVLSFLAAGANAASFTYVLDNVTFDDGLSATGSFTFDADTGGDCATGDSPCGTYSDVNISFNGSDFTQVCIAPDCTGVAADSTEVGFLTALGAGSGDPLLAIFFLAEGPVPPAGLSDAGGSFDMSNTSAGGMTYAPCADSVCSAPDFSNASFSTGGTVDSAPEPASLGLLFLGLAGTQALRRRRIAVRAR